MDARKSAAAGLRLAAGAAETAAALTETPHEWIIRASVEALRGAAAVLEAPPGWASARAPARDGLRLVLATLPGVRLAQARNMSAGAADLVDVVRGWVLQSERA